MISYLKGTILHKSEKKITVANDYIGYEVNITSKLTEKLQLGKSIELFIYTKVREDEISLFGFESQEELSFFKDLIATSGVGPKTALEILNQNLDQIKTAIMQKNSAFLSKIPGIGKKTAERIIIDLQNKVHPEKIEELPSFDDDKFEEVISALMNLGYQRQEIRGFLRKLSPETTTSEEIITQFLRNR
jgi:holliday junction DNA helicase RuvA